MKPGTRARFGEPPFTLIAEVLSQHTFGRRTVRLRGRTAATSTRRSTRSGTCRFRPTSSDPTSPAIASAIRPSTRVHAARWPRRRPACTYRRAILEALASRGVDRADLTLHVGYGTFKPIRTETWRSTRSIPRRSTISREAADRSRAREAGRRRVVAVGTTTTRTLEDRGCGARWPRRRVGGRVGALHLPRLPVPGRGRAADQLPPAAVLAPGPGVRLRGTRARARRLPGRGRRRLSVLQLRRRDA